MKRLVSSSKWSFRSAFIESPQAKIMRHQGSIIRDQVQSLKIIEKPMEERKKIEKENVQVLKGYFFKSF